MTLLTKVDVLEFTKCPLCDSWVYGRVKSTVYGTQVGEGYVFRYDLVDWVCSDCSRQIGPDWKRVEAFMIGKDITIEEALLELG